MRLSLISALVFSLGFVSQTYAATPALTVHINNKSDYCFILPKQRQTIGDAERPNGMRSYCTSPTGGQGSLPAGMFTKGGPHIKTGMGRGKYKQITGCFNPKKVPTLIPSDGGGQVDSNGGAGGRGNPANSACAGYAGYVSLIEPDIGHICLRCCMNLADCPTNRDTSGCQAVIPGTYC